MNNLNACYPESRFGGFSDIDGTMAFYSRVNGLINPEYVVVDVGCGRGKCGDDPVAIRRNLRILKGKCQKVIGIDVDETAQTNPYIDEFFLVENGNWPIGDDTVDLCICDSVLEHISDATKFFLESQRVLKPGGFFCARTPNVCSFFGLASILIPNRWHKRVLELVQKKRKGEDIFPTLYRCNTTGKLKKILTDNGFDFCIYGYEAEPAYANFSRILYCLMALSRRFIPNSLKSTLFIFAQKTCE